MFSKFFNSYTKKRVVLLICILLCVLKQPSFGQIPADGDFRNWDWQIQTPENWKMSNNEPSYAYGDVPPPFAKTKPGQGGAELGLFADVYKRSDYTKAKGWNLLVAKFGKTEGYPYFVLYNKYRAVIRVFYYVGERAQAYTYAVAKCLFTDPEIGHANPAILSSASPFKFAPDKYFNQTSLGNDVLVQEIPDGVVHNQWNAVDFPVMYDPLLNNKLYQGATLVLKVYGISEGDIDLHGKGAQTTDPNLLNNVKKSGFFYKSNSKGDGPLGLTDGNIAQIKKAAESVKSLSKDLEKIDPKDPGFVNNFKKDMQDLKIPGFLSKVGAISGAAGGYLSAVNFAIGLFGGGSTDPIINYQVFEFTGTIKTQSPLFTVNMKVPGVAMSPDVEHISVSDCSIGLINLKTTPTIQVTRPYHRWPYGFYGYTRKGYAGDYVKYKLDEDLELAYSSMPEEMELKDIKFAILCKPQKNGKNKNNDYYSITDPNIAFNTSSPLEFSGFNVKNVVYKDLNEGRFIIHKFGPNKEHPEQQEIYFGSPYRSKECLKGITFEVPEKTDVYLGVYAIFKVTGIDGPVIFHAKYLFDKNIVEVAKKTLDDQEEQPKFPYADYYLRLPFSYTLAKPHTFGFYQAETIKMSTGFSAPFNAQNGFTIPFIAKAASVTKCEGNTAINPIPYYCNPTPGGIIAKDLKKPN